MEVLILEKKKKETEKEKKITFEISLIHERKYVRNAR